MGDCKVKTMGHAFNRAAPDPKSVRAETKTMTSFTSQRQASSTSVTVLEMQGETSEVQRRVGTQTLLRSELPLGVDSLVRDSLRHAPPQPIELENAIELTEEVVMRLADQFTDNEVVLQGMAASLIAGTLDAVGRAQTVLTLDEVETLFNRLVAVSEGRPASQEALPTNARFFAAMLILREFMHHLRFTSVILEPSRAIE